MSLSALKENLDPSLDLFADLILNPAFPQEDFARLQTQRLAQIQQEKVQPIGIALRVFAGLLYGPGHAYGNPLTGSGTEESVSKMKRGDLVKVHQTWFKPNTATLIVVGDTRSSCAEAGRATDNIPMMASRPTRILENDRSKMGVFTAS